MSNNLPHYEDETPSSSDESPLSPAAIALATAVYDIEREMSVLGWDQAASLFALTKTSSILMQDTLAPELRSTIAATAENQPNHITAILQDNIEGDVIELLPQLAWPEEVDGVAVCMERMVVPPEAEVAAPEDEEARLKFFLNHEARDDVRLVCGVLRSGESWCALRARSHDNNSKVGGGSELVPELVEALRSTLSD